MDNWTFVNDEVNLVLGIAFWAGITLALIAAFLFLVHVVSKVKNPKPVHKVSILLTFAVVFGLIVTSATISVGSLEARNADGVTRTASLVNFLDERYGVTITDSAAEKLLDTSFIGNNSAGVITVEYTEELIPVKLVSFGGSDNTYTLVNVTTLEPVK